MPAVVEAVLVLRSWAWISQRIGRRRRLRRPDSLGFYDRPSPIFIGAGGDSNIFVKRGCAEGLGRGLEVIEKGYVGTPLNGDGRVVLGGGNHARTRAHFGVLSRLAFERQADGDF